MHIKDIKYPKEELGITLIALVITIIVLLILAAVSISAVIGENGIITKAKDAVEKTKNAAENERAILGNIENWIEQQMEKLGLDLIINPIRTTDTSIEIEVATKGNFVKYIYKIKRINETELTTVAQETDQNTYTFTGLESNIEYYIEVTGKTAAQTELTNNIIIKTENNNAPVIVELVASNIGENSFTITAKATDLDEDNLTYEFVLMKPGNAEESKGTETGASGISVSKTITGLSSNTTYEYYIKVTDGKTTETSLSQEITTLKSYLAKGETADGNQEYKDGHGDIATIPDGFTVSNIDGEYTIDTGLVIRDSVGNEFVWIPVLDINEMYDEWSYTGRLYDFSGTASSPKTYSSTGYREPAAVTGTGSSYDAVSSNLQSAGLLSSATVNSFRWLLEDEFAEMIRSVETYGGFYIGRYETGTLSGDNAVISKKGNTDISNQTWYTMYKKQKAMYDSSASVISGMIWGCQWDAVMRWMQSSRNSSVRTYVTSSTGKGQLSGSKIATGANENYKVNNIYDMAGNVAEFTIEAYGTDSRVDRRR